MAKRSQKLELTWYNKDRALIPTEHGKYGYTWVHPNDPRYCETRRLIFDNEYVGRQTPKHETLTYSDSADLDPQTDNLLIHGESGDVLEALVRVPELREKYAGQIKCIYIDPPFNTGDIFPNYDDNLEHSVWLTMMRDRLIHMHTLLSDRGSIWVHLDNGENHRMRVLLDEVFGPANFIADFLWRKVDSPNDNKVEVTPDHETICVYSKKASSQTAMWKRKIDWELIDAYPRTDPATGRKYRDRLLRKNGKNSFRGDRPTMWFGLVAPDGEEVFPVRDDGKDGCWAMGKRGVQQKDQEGLLIWKQRIDEATGRPKWVPYTREWAPESPERPWPTLWMDLPTSRQTKSHLKKIGLDGFDTPKPEPLIERILTICTSPGDLVLDVFGGSGATAATAHKLARRWVTCELVDENVENYLLPRMVKVLNDQDPGGISRGGPLERVSATDLPEKVSIESAQTVTRSMSLIKKHVSFPRTLERLVSEASQADRQQKDNSALSSNEREILLSLMSKLASTPGAEPDIVSILSSEVNEVFRTAPAEEVVNWRGGGAFRTARLSPPCFDYDPEFGLTTLTDVANDLDTLTASVAAQLRFRLTPGEYFHGASGATRLLVTRTPVDAAFATDVCSHLGDRESVIIASTVVLDGAAGAARKAARGSRVLHIPHDLFAPIEEDD